MFRKYNILFTVLAIGLGIWMNFQEEQTEKKAEKERGALRTYHADGTVTVHRSPGKDGPTEKQTEAFLKKIVVKANTRLKDYKSLCEKYRKVFDGVSDRSSLIKANSEFVEVVEANNEWLKNNGVKKYSGSSKVIQNYSNWYSKYEKALQNYTDLALKSRDYQLERFK